MVHALGCRGVPSAVVCLALAFASPASAQYFGRNKVQYHTLDFQVLKTEHFDIYFYPSEREGIDIAARLAERWYFRLERLFAHDLRGRQPLVLYASHPDFEQTNVIGGELTEGTGGVTEPLRRRIVLPLGGPIADTDHVIGHELVHAFQFDITSSPDAPPGQNGAERLPLWFIEGMAEYLSLGPIDANTAMWLRDAARQEKLPSIRDLDNPKYFPYRWGQAFWAYVAGRYGDETVGQLLERAGRSADVDAALKTVLGVTSKELSSEWQASIRRTYEPILAATAPPSEAGRLVVKGKALGGELNVGPAISPDGRLVAFLSERGFFSIDLYVADAMTGRIVRKLTSTATDPHYSSIQFIYSAGAWDSASQRIAIGAVAAGRPALAIFEAQTGKQEREIAIPDVDEILNPTWAPDGHAIAFTGMKRGLTDLFVYDLNASKLRQLTSDAYADLQPSWSPDGKRIAFATDRFSSDLTSLAIGAYRLALVDPESGAIEPVRVFTNGKNINPQWSPDSQALYFISDRDGIPNLYRVTLASGDLAQLTAIGTGISGITNSSPAISAATRSDIVAFSVYDSGRYDIFTLDAAGRGGPLKVLGANAAVLPPADRKPSEVTALLANAAFGLPEAQVQVTEPYKSKLSLEGVSQPMVGVGASRFGTTIGGGISFYFGDMLGNHVLATAVQFNSGWTGKFSPSDIAAEVAYFNQARRWNWGFIAGQVPYLSGGYQSGISVTANRDLVQTDQLFIYRQTERSASGLVAYPLDRARRVEFQGGVSRISFEEVINTTQYSLYTGQIYQDTTETIPLAESLTLGTTSAAYVFDTSNFGATSPVQGQRYRFEVDPIVGSINYTGVLADYRHYLMPASFYTLAGRVLHYARYGSGGEDSRLFPLYIGYPGLVRGYDITSFNASECVSTATSQCPAIDALLGSRILVGGLEFRFPLLRPFGVTRRMYGPLPVEVALFTDAGVAWNTGQKPSWFGGKRDGVSSAGVALRVNLMGYAVGEFDFTHPFQRPGQGWVFGFNLMPGW